MASVVPHGMARGGVAVSIQEAGVERNGFSRFDGIGEWQTRR